MASRSTSRTVQRFVHCISAMEAEQLLFTKGIDGSFLVRTSTNDPNVYFLSYRVLNKVIHITFETTEDGFTAKNLPNEYPTIEALITEVQQLMPGLDYPLWPSDPAPDGLLPRLFFGRLSTKHAERLLLDPDSPADRNFLIRSSTSCSDQIVLSVRLATGKVVHILTHRQGDRFLLKGKENERSFDGFNQLLDYYMEGRTIMQQEDGTVIHLAKPMICPWNNDPSGATGKTATFSSKPATNSHHNATEEFLEPTSPIYRNARNKRTGNVYEDVN